MMRCAEDGAAWESGMKVPGSVLMVVGKALVLDRAAAWVTRVSMRDCAAGSVEAGGELLASASSRCGLVVDTHPASASHAHPRAADEQYTYGQAVRMVRDATRWGGEARTFCTSPAISCVSASFRAADCCRTRMAPSRERGGMGEPRRDAGAGVGTVSFRSSSSASRRASWASSSATRRRAAERASRSRSHSSRSAVSSAAEYARPAAVHVVCGCSCKRCGLGGTVDYRE